MPSAVEIHPTELKGLVTAADLPQAEGEWPGLRAFFDGIHWSERPATFLELVWRFEQHRLLDCSSELAAAA